jgi:hypothetical protein
MPAPWGLQLGRSQGNLANRRFNECPLNENINRAIEELVALGDVHPYLLADGTIELRPWPASPELSQKVAQILSRAGVRELRPWVWGVVDAERATEPP